MSKELKIELFNIYDVVVFEDDNGITQDCVCIIVKDIEANKIVDAVECNNHSISIYENGSYNVWKKDGKGMPYYETNKKIIHLYTLKNDNRYYEVYPTSDYESLDNSNPSEALKELNIIKHLEIGFDKDGKPITVGMGKGIDIIRQALLKAQEQEELLKSGNLSDGYHTFNQLYYQRCILFASLVRLNKEKSWKSFKHSDGKYCFDSNGEWFIVGIDTPLGSYTYHYEKKYWDLFECQELECGKEWDGHTEDDVTRLLSLSIEKEEGEK